MRGCHRSRATVKETVAFWVTLHLPDERKKKTAVCAQNVPQQVCPNEEQATIQTFLAVAFSVKDDGLDGGRLHRVVVEVSV